MSSKDRSHSSSELVLISVIRAKVMMPATMSVVPVGSRCGTAEPAVRLRPPSERGHFPAAQRMAGAAVAGARGKLGAVGDRKGCTHLMMTAVHLMLAVKF